MRLDEQERGRVGVAWSFVDRIGCWGGGEGRVVTSSATCTMTGVFALSGCRCGRIWLREEATYQKGPDELRGGCWVAPVKRRFLVLIAFELAPWAAHAIEASRQ
jgi:hypothetical protein